MTAMLLPAPSARSRVRRLLLLATLTTAAAAAPALSFAEDAAYPTSPDYPGEIDKLQAELDQSKKAADAARAAEAAATAERDRLAAQVAATEEQRKTIADQLAALDATLAALKRQLDEANAKVAAIEAAKTLKFDGTLKRKGKFKYTLTGPLTTGDGTSLSKAACQGVKYRLKSSTVLKSGKLRVDYSGDRSKDIVFRKGKCSMRSRLNYSPAFKGLRVQIDVSLTATLAGEKAATSLTEGPLALR